MLSERWDIDITFTAITPRPNLAGPGGNSTAHFDPIIGPISDSLYDIWWRLMFNASIIEVLARRGSRLDKTQLRDIDAWAKDLHAHVQTLITMRDDLFGEPSPP